MKMKLGYQARVNRVWRTRNPKKIRGHFRKENKNEY